MQQLRRSLLGLSATLVFSFACLAPVALPAADAKKSSARKSDARKQDDLRLQKIFAGQAPKDLRDLRLMETRQKELIERVRKYTVAVRVGQAHGSGVLVSKDGFILTAAHVAQRKGLLVEVRLASGEVARGRTLGMYFGTDAGLMKMEPLKRNGKPVEWPHAELGLSDKLRPGQWCLAAGHPGGFQEARKAVFRVGRILSSQSEVIKTDCPLIGGDSGGPLFDMAGDVIGIHSRIGNSLTQNLHVPANMYAENWDRLAKSEEWGQLPGMRPVIGVSGDRNDDEALIRRVTPGGAAARAGIQKDDVVLRFDGMEIDSFRDLQAAIAKRRPGQRVQVVVRRGEKRINLTLRIEGR